MAATQGAGTFTAPKGTNEAHQLVIDAHQALSKVVAKLANLADNSELALLEHAQACLANLHAKYHSQAGTAAEPLSK